MNRLQDKVAVVSGGASGIGAAVVRLFVEEGARVLACDIQPPLDAALRTLLDEAPEKVRFTTCDASKESDVAAAVALATETWGRLDAAVACAGVPGQGSDIDLAVDEWDRIMAINARGVFLLTKHALPPMIAGGGGSITNISSAYGVVGAPGFAAYCASKGAVRTFTKSTAVEHAHQRIRANSIHPGVIETPMLQGIFDRSDDPEATRAAFSAQQPNGFNGAPGDIAWGCVYLASDEARFVNGVELPIDGGLLAG
ncbi:glucose 1-dehydrogenase [Novosphingobium sp. fls2-241-R2A-195]|jgi:NAD(P)-dependent dehydrogenase (short-subunit alcohol dehydrogenase family)|uniref:SDR family NAD(P)-dependent oxidoreductase n=1 Tax=Novosphingobium sp. fls2-241-R2A-195 TaxID=3040296 RepID=UPI00254AACB6|nr:glucose 1-dehydrogenase [Novosphingobium sp. fls2-241-R2A-195]